MPVNDLTFNQLATVLNSITQQATGQIAATPTNTSEFISVATMALKAGYDPVLNAISQVLSRTIFSIRPYSRKFGGLMVSEQRYGNHVRKLQSYDKPFVDDNRMGLEDGQSIDMYKVNKPGVIQTNFYGANVYSKYMTLFKDQLDNAFSGPDEFGRFVAMVMQNASDQIEQAHESTARATIANYITGKIKGAETGAERPQNVIHLLSEYNAETGLQLTATTIMQPENFKAFSQWMFARIRTVSQMMTERTVLFHTNITDKSIPRHTPLNRQKVYLYAPMFNNIDASVLSNTFNTKYLEIVDHEAVNFWQSSQTPANIYAKPVYLQQSGELGVADDNVSVSNLVGVIFDEEAAGYTSVNQWSAPTPFNVDGGYTNLYWHFTDRYWNDFTENGVILLLD